jgi:hypothetical protein
MRIARVWSRGDLSTAVDGPQIYRLADIPRSISWTEVGQVLGCVEAVGCLLRCYRQGLDPASRLHQLSTFMGHVDPISTAVYLTITPTLLQEANRRYEAFAEPIWTEVLR